MEEPRASILVIKKQSSSLLNMMFTCSLFLISLSSAYCERIVAPLHNESPWLLKLLEEATNRHHSYTPQMEDEAIWYLQFHHDSEETHKRFEAEILLIAKYDKPYNPPEALEEAVSLWKSDTESWTIMNATIDVGCARRDDYQRNLRPKHPLLEEEKHDDDQGALWFSTSLVLVVFATKRIIQQFVDINNVNCSYGK